MVRRLSALLLVVHGLCAETYVAAIGPFLPGRRHEDQMLQLAIVGAFQALYEKHTFVGFTFPHVAHLLRHPALCAYMGFRAGKGWPTSTALPLANASKYRAMRATLGEQYAAINKRGSLPHGRLNRDADSPRAFRPLRA